MAGHGWTRQWALTLFAVSAALSTCAEEEGTKQDRLPARQFNSKVPFRVWALLEVGQPPKEVGETPSNQKLAIPSCHKWWVLPLGRPDMAAVAKELVVQKVPGLELSQDASDVALVHLRGLKGLQWLTLRYTRVTDAGLTQLRGLKGLQELDLSGSHVTDAGVAHLGECKGLQRLVVKGTEVTDAGIAELKKSLPDLKVER